MRQSVMSLSSGANELFGIKVSGDNVVKMEMKFRRMEEEGSFKFIFPENPQKDSYTRLKRFASVPALKK